LIYYRGRE